MPYVITEACIDVKDGACADVCPVACIHTDDNSPMYYIDPRGCIDCRACELVCPVNAIFPGDDVPAHLESYIAVNEGYFARV